MARRADGRRAARRKSRLLELESDYSIEGSWRIIRNLAIIAAILAMRIVHAHGGVCGALEIKPGFRTLFAVKHFRIGG
jgi:hypothetical protein